MLGVRAFSAHTPQRGVGRVCLRSQSGAPPARSHPRSRRSRRRKHRSGAPPPARSDPKSRRSRRHKHKPQRGSPRRPSRVSNPQQRRRHRAILTRPRLVAARCQSIPHSAQDRSSPPRRHRPATSTRQQESRLAVGVTGTSPAPQAATMVRQSVRRVNDNIAKTEGVTRHNKGLLQQPLRDVSKSIRRSTTRHHAHRN